MIFFKHLRIFLLSFLAVLIYSNQTFAAPKSERERIQQLAQSGNYKDAFAAYERFILEGDEDENYVSQDIENAVSALRSLNDYSQVDTFLEKIAARYPKSPNALVAVAHSYLSTQHNGYLIGNEFTRGYQRGGGQWADATARDRVRALQLLFEAVSIVQTSAKQTSAANVYQTLSEALYTSSGYRGESWKLQSLTDLTKLPDYSESSPYYGGDSRGAPVDVDGNPVYYQIPENLDAAKSDGERWRWTIVQLAKQGGSFRGQSLYIWAEFLRNTLGERTLANYYWFTPRNFPEDDKKSDTGTFALHTLGEDETIARLANGIRRFKLPDEFNYVKIYRELTKDQESGYDSTAVESLAQIFEDRRQYKKAAEMWQEAIRRSGSQNDRTDYRRQRLDQIVGAWGRFEVAENAPSGGNAQLDYLFRNGSNVSLRAYEIKVDKLLEDVKDYLQSNPSELNWEKLNIENLGYRLVTKHEDQYLGEKVAEWKEELKPADNHFDRRVTLQTPLKKAGAYLIKATIAGGNTSSIVLWVSDTAIVRKRIGDQVMYYVVDALSGKPLSNMQLDLFGYEQKSRDNAGSWVGLTRRWYDVITKSLKRETDESGMVFLGKTDQETGYQWLATASNKEGRLAFLGFSSFWYGNYYPNWNQPVYDETKVYVMTDRPVYRPGQTAKFKIWVRNARYDGDTSSGLAGRKFSVEIHNPRSEKVLTKNFESDSYGGFFGELELAKDTVLGQYTVNVAGYSQVGTFRVEEYKKPEFEVNIEAPKEPMMLGDKISAKITAKYYFGAPVTKAKIKLKVLRSEYNATWYPLGIWDWFYGPGYWWFAYDYAWYPGWIEWGCRRPFPMWYNWSPQPPEVVQEQEVEIGEDGTFPVLIDTLSAKELHGDSDQKYDITAEVVDESRRTIVGTGQVLVARKPFRVYTWLERGYYQAGDSVKAFISAQSLDHRPVQGAGKLSLLKISYDAASKPNESVVQTWDLNTDDQGKADTQLVPKQPGQYRLSYTLTDSKERTVEGGYIFTVLGEGSKSDGARFESIELIPEKREYAPGETAKVLLNSNHANANVLFFLRPLNGVYQKPELVQLHGKSLVKSVSVETADIPNFFVEALTVFDGRVYSETKEIVVPPFGKTLNVSVLPSKTEYKPGEKASVELKLTDENGKPFVGSMVLTAYDKAVEYISGGSNVSNIREFFWKWRRSHNPTKEDSLERYSQPMTEPGATAMAFLGIFGQSVADELGLDRDEGRSDKKSDSRKLGFEAKAKGGGIVMRSAAVGMATGAMSDGAALEKSESVDAFMPQAVAAPAPASGFQDKLRVVSQPVVQPTVRKEFADTAYWASNIETDKDGIAKVEFPMPENLTEWKIRTWALGAGTRVGEGEVSVTTTKNLLLRMQTPRFFVEKDEVVLTANIHNYLKSDKQVTAQLEFEGEHLQLLGDAEQRLSVKAGGEARVNWRVKVLSEGEAVIRMKALTDEESDAMELRIPVYVHGMLKTESWSGALRPEDRTGSIKIRVPEERRPEQTRLEIRYSPTLAGAMVDALPYLVSYPYGCTEQTLSRFLPTVITQNILKEMGLDLKSIRDKRVNLNAQEIGNAKERAGQWKQYNDDYAPKNPIFDEDEVASMSRAGLERIVSMQLSDGGWGWFSGYGEYSSPHTTAYVVHSLQLARAVGLQVPEESLRRGLNWLENYQAAEIRRLKNWSTKTKPWKQYADNMDAFIFMVLVEADQVDHDMLEFLYRDRTEVSVYAKEMFGIALHQLKETAKLSMIRKNIEQFLVQDDENQTAYLKLPEDNYWWNWYGSNIEAQSYYLKLLSRIEPKGSIASRVAKYLLNNRKNAAYWKSTRDTAIAIEALAEFMKASGEAEPNAKVSILVDGKVLREVQITKNNLFTFDGTVVLESAELSSGEHKIEVRKEGKSPLYYNAYLTNFTLEDHITRAGLEVKVNRKLYKLVKEEGEHLSRGSSGQALVEKSETYRKEEITDAATLKSGDLLEVELEIESKNDYEYLVFEDFKAAGFEPVDVRSGYMNRSGLNAYVEYRDNRVAFFVQNLPRGRHSVSYRTRAEIPGSFSALPTQAHAMYAPELKANSDEIKLGITD